MRRLARLPRGGPALDLWTTTAGSPSSTPGFDRMEAIGARPLNRPSVLRWNTDIAGPVPRRGMSHTHLSPPPTEDSGSRILGESTSRCSRHGGWDEAVMKPAISADGFSTERTSLASAALESVGPRHHACARRRAHAAASCRRSAPRRRTCDDVLRAAPSVTRSASGRRPVSSASRASRRTDRADRPLADSRRSCARAS